MLKIDSLLQASTFLFKVRFLGDVQTYMKNNQSIKVTLESFNASIICNTLPERISNLVYDNVTTDSVALRWDEHSSLAPGITFQHYKLIITTVKSETDELSPIVKHPQNTHYTMNELQTNTNYKIKVLVVATYGNSPESDELKIQTNGQMESNATAEIYEAIVSLYLISSGFIFSKKKCRFFCLLQI